MWTRRSVLLGAGGLLGGVAWPSLAAVGSKRLIVVLASGGWDVTYALAPKLGVPGVDGPDLDEDPDDPDDREAVRTIAGIPLVVNDVKRPAVSRFFEVHGRFATVVNGLFTASISHEAALVRALTGTGDEGAPDVGAILGRNADGPLGYVDLSGQGFFGPYGATCGRLGYGGQAALLLDPGQLVAPERTGVVYPTFAPSAVDLAALDAFVAGRSAGSPVGASLRDARRRADQLRAKLPPVLDGLAVGESTDLIRDGKAAVELLAAGVCRAVLVDSRAHWDTHADNAQQHASWQALFSGLKLLVDGLIDRSMLADTVVVVLSEITRTPVRNGDDGKDHWPYASAVVIGGGIGGGRALGATTDQLEAAPIDLTTGLPDPKGAIARYDHFVAGILELLDVDPGAFLPGITPLRGF